MTMSSKSKVFINGENEVVDLQALLHDLILGAKNMRVVLGEGAHPHDAMNSTRGLVAVDDAEFGDFHRQVAIGFQAVLEDLHVPRTIHRLQGEDSFVLGLRDEHVLAKSLPMAGSLPERAVEHLGRIHFDVAELALAPPHVGNQRLEQGPALRVPENRAGPFFLKMEQIHFPPQAAMIPPLGFFQLLQIGRELICLGKGRCVDPLEHRLRRIAAPIGARDFHQFEGVADLARRGHMGAATEVEPVALLVDFQGLVGGDRLDEFDLESLAMRREPGRGFFACPNLLREGFVASNDLSHFHFDRGKILRRERLRAIEIVIKAVLDHRPDGDLRAGKERLHRLGEDMRGVVTDEFERSFVVAGEELNSAVARQGIGEVAQGAINRHRDGALGERWRNAFDNIKTADAGLECA